MSELIRISPKAIKKLKLWALFCCAAMELGVKIDELPEWQSWLKSRRGKAMTKVIMSDALYRSAEFTDASGIPTKEYSTATRWARINALAVETVKRYIKEVEGM